MTDLQLYLAIGLPILFNGGLAVMMSNHFNAQLASVREDIREMRGDIKLLTGKVYEMMEKR
jgi:hypothetical protein